MCAICLVSGLDFEWRAKKACEGRVVGESRKRAKKSSLSLSLSSLHSDLNSRFCCCCCLAHLKCTHHYLESTSSCLSIFFFFRVLSKIKLRLIVVAEREDDDE